MFAWLSSGHVVVSIAEMFRKKKRYREKCVEQACHNKSWQMINVCWNMWITSFLMQNHTKMVGLSVAECLQKHCLHLINGSRCVKCPHSCTDAIWPAGSPSLTRVRYLPQLWDLWQTKIKNSLWWRNIFHILLLLSNDPELSVGTRVFL